MMPSQVFLPSDDFVPLLVDDPDLKTTELWSVVDTLPTKDSGLALVREVEAVDTGIMFALDAPLDTELESEDSLTLDATVATNLEAEDELLAKKPWSDDWPLGFLVKMTTSNPSTTALMRAYSSYESQVRQGVTCSLCFWVTMQWTPLPVKALSSKGLRILTWDCDKYYN